MSTTIDSLVIDIEASSSKAATEIDQLASALGRLKESGKISATVRNLNNLKSVLAGFSVSAGTLGGIKAISEAFNGLSSIGKLSGLSSAINTLKKIPDITKSLDTATISAFTQKMNQLASALKPLATELNIVSTSFSKLPVKLRQIVSGVDRMKKSVDSATASHKAHGDALNKSSINIAAAIHNITAYVQALQIVIQKMSEAISLAVEWDGVQARFGRAFGDSAQETLEYVEKISKSLLINKQEFMQYSSLFAEMLTGFGVNQADAGKMAIGYTELAYDIWAAYNDVYKNLGGEEGAIAAVRSAIAGEVEPIRRAGFTIVDSQLAITAAMYDVEYSTQNATEAQKSYLRYLTMVNQASERNIVGVYAAEMRTAEGALRTLSQQMKVFTQTLGSLFIPLLSAVLPYLTAFVQLLTEAITAIAKFFGISMFEIDWSRGVSDLATGAGEATDNLKSAGAAAKKLKNYTMGFDELNVINPDSGGGGAGGAGGAGAGAWDGLDVDSLWNEEILKGASKQIEEIKEKLKGLIPLIGLAATGFLAFKILPSFINALGVTKALLGAIKGNKAGLSALTFLGKGKLANGLLKLQDVGLALTKNKLFKKGLVSSIVGSSSSIAAGLASLLGIVAGVASLAAGLVLVYKKSENFRKGLETLWTGVKKVVGGIKELASVTKQLVQNEFAKWNSFFSKFEAPQVLGELINSTKEFLSIFELGLGDVLVLLGSLALFGPVGAGVAAAILGGVKLIGHAASDAIDEVDVLGDGISEVTKEKLEPFLETMTDLDTTIKYLDWSDKIISEEDVNEVERKLEEIVNAIVNELDADRNEALANIRPLKGVMSALEYAELVDKINEMYGNQKEAVLKGEAEILEIVSQAREEGRKITEEEAAKIIAIETSMKEQAVQLMADNEAESLVILQRLKDSAANITAEQASEIIKNAVETRDKTIKAAEEQYDKQITEAEKLYDAELISEEAYTSMKEDALELKNESIKAAKTQFSTIKTTAETELGATAKYIDTETGEILSNWDIWMSNLRKGWSETWALIKSGWNDIFGGDNIGKFNVSAGLLNLPSVPTYASGGYVSTGQMFIAREAGAELVGSINGRTAVANNDQIVAAVSQGVYSAVVSAMSQTAGSGGEQRISVFLDGKQLYSSIKKTETERGRNIMGSQLGYSY